VRGKLEGYNWNLVHTYPRRLVLKVTEADGDRLRHHVFASDTGFRHTGSPREAPFDGRLWEEPSMAVHSAVLDHGTPCLAFALRERVHVNVMTAPLAALGLSPGPWLQELKRAIYENRPARTVLEVPLSGGGRETRRFTVGDLADRVVRITRGQSLAYVTDAVFSPRNSGAVTALARGVDHIYIEAAFMEADEPVARTKKHLTAAQAGTLAALAGARAFTLFHHSPRYQGRPVDPRGEAEAAYRKAGGGSDG
jgi:ribonuclease Z